MLGRIFEQVPNRIQAMQYDGTNGSDIEYWSKGQAFGIDEEDRGDDPDCDFQLLSSAHSNYVKIYKGDWIAKKANGEYMRINESTFRQNYKEIKS